MWAAMNGHTDVAAALIFAGADISAAGNDGCGSPSVPHPAPQPCVGRSTAEDLAIAENKSAEYTTAVRKVRLDSALPVRRRPGWALHATRPTAGVAWLARQ